MTVADRPPLAYGPTGIRGLIEFVRADCPHHHTDLCGTCVEHASRAQLYGALAHAETQADDPRIGQTLLSENDVRLLIALLDGYDAGRVA